MFKQFFFLKFKYLSWQNDDTSTLEKSPVLKGQAYEYSWSEKYSPVYGRSTSCIKTLTKNKLH